MHIQRLTAEPESEMCQFCQNNFFKIGKQKLQSKEQNVGLIGGNLGKIHVVS